MPHLTRTEPGSGQRRNEEGADIVGQLTALGFGLGLIVPVMTSSLLGSVESGRSGVAAGPSTPPVRRAA
jgi:hypothetical protein